MLQGFCFPPAHISVLSFQSQRPPQTCLPQALPRYSPLFSSFSRPDSLFLFHSLPLLLPLIEEEKGVCFLKQLTCCLPLFFSHLVSLASTPSSLFPLTGALHVDSSPYSPAYLSPPPESSWRRSVSRAGRISCPLSDLSLAGAGDGSGPAGPGFQQYLLP